jgi:hypothetical protein
VIHRTIRRAVLCSRCVTSLLCLVILFCAAGITVAAVVGDQVELNATHQAGVPLHKEPRGTNDFQHAPDGTRAQVTEVAKGGQWLKLSLPDGRTGWVTSRYVSRPPTGAPSPGTSPTAKKPQRVEEGLVERVADGDTVTVITANQTKLRIRMFGVDTLETKAPVGLSSTSGKRLQSSRSEWRRGVLSQICFFGNFSVCKLLNFQYSTLGFWLQN